MNELISVIVPIYNSEAYLAKCISSIISQTYKNLEIILIDDGSSDASGEICEGFAENDNRIKVLHQENVGVSAARNNGMKTASGEYVTFVDSDDYIADNYISVLYENMDDGIDMVISKPEARHPDGKKYKYWPFNERNSVVMDTTDLRNMNWRYRHLWMAGVLYKRSTISDLKFNTNYYVGEDLLFYFSAFKKCKTVKYIPEKLYFYVLYPESAFHGKFNDNKFTEYYAWRDICALYEGHPLHERFLENFELRCCRIYMAMIENGYADDERVNDLIKAIKANLKYGMHIHGYPSIYKRNFVWFSILPKPLHKVVYHFQAFLINRISWVAGKIKGVIKKIIKR